MTAGERVRGDPHRHRPSPLITLTLADSLDVLIRPGLPVHIPDAVYIEATRVRSAPGATRIVDWINTRLPQVRLIPTDIGIDQQRRIEEGRPGPPRRAAEAGAEGLAVEAQ